MENFGFIGYEEERKVFAEYLRCTLSAPNQSLPLLMYYGQSGNGKTTFLQKLQRDCDERNVAWVSFNLEAASYRPTVKINTLNDVIRSLAEAAKLKSTEPLLTQRLKALIADLKNISRSKVPIDPSDTITSIASGVFSAGSTLISGGSEFSAAVTVATSTASTLVRGIKNLQIEWASKKLVSEDKIDFLGRFSQCFVDRPQHGVKVVLFFDTTDVELGDASYTWLEELYLTLSQQGFLIVIVGQRELTAWLPQENVKNIPLGGFTEAETDQYLSRVEKQFRSHSLQLQDMPIKLRHEIKQYSLCRKEKIKRKTLCYYQPIKIDQCIIYLENEIRQGKGYPKTLQLSQDEVLNALRKKWAGTPHFRVWSWLVMLTETPFFDEGFAKKIYRQKFHDDNSAKSDDDWNFLIASRLMTKCIDQNGAKQEIFYEIHDIYKKILCRDSKQDFLEFDKMAVAYWIDRASQELNEHGLYVMEKPYWQKMVALSLFHTQKTESSSDKFLNESNLSVLSFLLEIYWWWGENVPQEYWNRLIDETVQSLTDSQLADNHLPQANNEQRRKLHAALQSIQEFDLAWPKAWQRDPDRWIPSDRWDYTTVLKKINDFRSIAGFRSGVAFSAKSRQLQERIDAILSFYEGHAYRFLARQQTDPAAFYEKAKQAFETSAEKGHGGISINTNIYKLIWSHVALAELHSDQDQFDVATDYAEQAFRDLRSLPQDEPGVEREGLSNVYCVLSTIAIRQGDWKNAGKMRGRALLYSYGFYASDQDEYAYAYYHTYLRQCVKEDLTAIFQKSPHGALDYQQGFQEQWQIRRQNDAANVSVDSVIQSVLEILPEKLNEEPEMISEELFAKSEAEFEHLAYSFSLR